MPSNLLKAEPEVLAMYAYLLDLAEPDPPEPTFADHLRLHNLLLERVWGRTSNRAKNEDEEEGANEDEDWDVDPDEDPNHNVRPLMGVPPASGGDTNELADALMDLSLGVRRLGVLLSEATEAEWRAVRARHEEFETALAELPQKPRRSKVVGFRSTP